MINTNRVLSAVLKRAQKKEPLWRVVLPDAHYVSVAEYCLARLGAEEDAFRDDLYRDMTGPYGRCLTDRPSLEDLADVQCELMQYGGNLYRKACRRRDGKALYFRDDAIRFRKKSCYEGQYYVLDGAPLVLVWDLETDVCDLLITALVKRE